MTRRKLVVLTLLLSPGCRIGGPDGSATEPIDPAADGAVDERDAASGNEEDDPPPIPADGAGPAPQDDAGPAGAPPPPVDAAMPAPSDADVGCTPPADIECDPVSGEGCLPLMQCLVDPASAAPAAYCVFSALLLEETCVQDELSTNCPPQYTCVRGECRKYCYCDADCDDGAACADPSGEGGSDAFKLCQRFAP